MHMREPVSPKGPASVKKWTLGDFPGESMGQESPAGAGDTDPGLGRPHMSWATKFMAATTGSLRATCRESMRCNKKVLRWRSKDPCAAESCWTWRSQINRYSKNKKTLTPVPLLNWPRGAITNFRSHPAFSATSFLLLQDPNPGYHCLALDVTFYLTDWQGKKSECVRAKLPFTKPWWGYDNYSSRVAALYFPSPSEFQERYGVIS